MADISRDEFGEGEGLELINFLPYQLSVVANRVSQSIGRIFKEKFDLQIPEWRILVTLYAVDSMSFNEVTEKTSMDKTRVSRAQRRMIDLKLISTQIDPNDKRKINLSLTQQGREICKSIIPEAKARDAWLQEVISQEERAQLEIIMAKLLERTKELDS
jgi:DNA-binding MarR family transcriptional regulator